MTDMVQLAPEAKVAPQVVVWPKSDAFVPVKEIAMALIGEFVLLVTVTT